MKLTFQIEQIALHPRDPQAARELLAAMGAVEWHRDTVRARGEVFDAVAENTAELQFNYDLSSGEPELEILTYTDGPNWMDLRPDADPHRVSHLGMHCSTEELDRWKVFFANRNIGIAQEVNTLTHTNPAIAGRRWYTYAIFDTHSILGVDIKFIVRRAEAPE